VLTVVLGRIQLLKKQIKDPLILSSLDMIEKSALDGASKVRKIQEFSRPKEGSLDEVIDLNKLLQEVVEITRPKWDIAAKIKGILIEPVLALEKNLFIYGDSSDLRNAFTNIIFNAVDAMPEGGALSIKSHYHNNQVVIEFMDTGIGMTEEVQEKIFDPFFTTKGVLGTGLGMSEVWGIIKRHNGRITINSHVGKGTIIRLFLTLAEKPVEQDIAQINRQIEPCNILVVDDEEYILEIMKELLTELGHTVTTFSSAPKALDNFKQNRYDIVLTDLGMPEMNGLEMATKIKEFSPQTLVIMMSGWGLSLDEKNTSNVIDYIINKPFSVEKIVFIISESTAKIKQLAGQ
jgi:CheY-like chemotaxis protein